MLGPTIHLGPIRIIFTDDTNAPSAAADGNFQVGDQVWKRTPTTGTAPGWVCTAAGTGATATWKAQASLA